MPMGTSRYFVRKTTIPPPKRPRRIHVSPCHDTPILFGDEVKRCPWGHLGNIMRTSYIPPPLGLEESMSAHARQAHSPRRFSSFCPRTAEKTRKKATKPIAGKVAGKVFRRKSRRPDGRSFLVPISDTIPRSLPKSEPKKGVPHGLPRLPQHPPPYIA